MKKGFLEEDFGFGLGFSLTASVSSKEVGDSPDSTET